MDGIAERKQIELMEVWKLFRGKERELTLSSLPLQIEDWGHKAPRGFNILENGRNRVIG